MTWIQCKPSLLDEDTPQYLLDEQFYRRRIELPGSPGAVLLVSGEPSEMGPILFAMFEFYSQSDDGVTTYQMIFQGEGYAGNLRECRHMWWGEEGYTLYLPLEATAAALTALKEWFD